jgi:RHS repeat-associated protein
LVTGKLTNYTWDYRNRLTKVTSGSQVVEYLYDAEDKRVGKKINGTTTEKYVYDGADIALVVDSAGTLVERYLFGDGVDNVLSREKGGAVVWSLGDRQGSVVDLVDEGGNVLNHFVYDSFGNRTGDTTVEFRFGYTGRELDGETGLYYYRARYYDPTMGRFISEDPAGFGAGDTNLYRYVGNNPTNATDPSGMWVNFAIGAGVGFALDLGFQLLENKGNIWKTDLTRLAISTASGAIGGGIGGGLVKGGALLTGTALAETGLSLGARTAINAGVGFNLGYYGKVTENAVKGKELTEGALSIGIAGGAGAAAGELIQAGIGAAWSKYTRLDRVGKSLDDMAGETQDLIRQIDDLQARSTTADQLSVFGASDTSHNSGKITGATGPISGRIYNETQIGIPIKSSSLDKVKINHRGIDTVQHHTNKFNNPTSPYNPSNDYMVRRLRMIADGEINPGASQ